MSKEFAMLAHWWDGSFEQIQNTLCSRKYNGWSALWDGGITRGMPANDVPWYYRGKDKHETSTGLWSLGRDNKPKVIHAPSYFISTLPKLLPVHGEIWFDDRIDIIKQYCARKIGYHPMWYNIKFISFNIKPYELWEGIEIINGHPVLLHNIKYKGDNLTIFNYDPLGINIKKDVIYTYKDILNMLGWYENETFKVISAKYIETEKDLIEMQTKAIKEKWEGLMFAKDEWQYELKRSYSNLKWKPDYDAEAIVYGYEDGKTGKNVGKVASLKATMIWDRQVKSLHGGKGYMEGMEVEFHVSGLTDEEREWKNCKSIYPIGSIVKFTFKEVSVHGIPQSCNIYREGK